MNIVFREKIIKIFIAAAAAPSGDNSQPWRFIVRAPNILEFHAIPEKDNKLLNVDQSGTLIALGAAIENAELEAKSLGFNPEIYLNNGGTLIATCILHKGGEFSSKEQYLQQAIPLRHSNRKAYKKKPLADSDRHVLFDAARKEVTAFFSLIEDKKSMSLISRALTTMEEIALKNKSTHRLFFESIFWSKERNVVGGSGLYIKTLELPPPAQLFFKILRYWPVAHFLAQIGFPKMVARMNAEQNASASAFGVISLDRFDRISYIKAGRMLQRIWLATTARKMSFQIVTGLLFLARAVKQESSSFFSTEECESAQKAYATIRENLKGSNEPLIMFRIGYANAPSAVSFRKQPDITYIQ